MTDLVCRPGLVSSSIVGTVPSMAGNETASSRTLTRRDCLYLVSSRKTLSHGSTLWRKKFFPPKTHFSFLVLLHTSLEKLAKVVTRVLIELPMSDILMIIHCSLSPSLVIPHFCHLVSSITSQAVSSQDEVLLFGLILEFAVSSPAFIPYMKWCLQPNSAY